MQVVNLLLPHCFRHAAGRVELCVRLLGAPNTGRAGAHDDGDAMRADAIGKFPHRRQHAVLLQTEPRELVVATLQTVQSLRQRDIFNAVDAANPGIEVATVEIVTAKPGLPLAKRTAKRRQSDSGRGRCGVLRNS